MTVEFALVPSVSKRIAQIILLFILIQSHAFCFYDSVIGLLYIKFTVGYNAVIKAKGVRLI